MIQGWLYLGTGHLLYQQSVSNIKEYYVNCQSIHRMIYSQVHIKIHIIEARTNQFRITFRLSSASLVFFDFALKICSFEEELN